MATVHTVKIDALHGVRVDRSSTEAVRVAFLVGGVAMFSKVVPLESAAAFRDSLTLALEDEPEPARRTIDVGGNQGRGNPPARA